MRRPSLHLLMMLFVLVAAPATRAETTSVDIPVWAGTDAQPDMPAPVITSDGTIVFAVRVSNHRVDVRRLASGSDAVEPVTSLVVPDEGLVGGPFLEVRLTAAGRGFFLSSDDFLVAIHCCSNGYSQAHVVWYETPAAEGVDMPLCTAGGEPAETVIADAEHALVACAQTSNAVIRDLASGQEQPIDLTNSQAPFLAGHFIAGIGAEMEADGTIEHFGTVTDWTTGSTLRKVRNASPGVVLPDGTYIYRLNRTLYRWDAAASAPVELAGVDGDIVAAAGGRLLTVDDDQHGIRVWTLQGAPVAHLAGVGRTVSFDGQHVVLLSHACTQARVISWDVADPAPPLLKPICGPISVGRVEARRPAARVLLTCPLEIEQGCLGGIELSRPAPMPRHGARVILRPGQQRWYPLTARLSRQGCRSLVRRTRVWRLRRLTDTVYGQQYSSVLRRPSARCGA